MIEGTYTAYEVELRGHAGVAPKGQDLVCAAVSMLVCGMAARLRQAERLETAVLEPGYAHVVGTPGTISRQAVSFVAAGLHLLSQIYPAEISITQGTKGVTHGEKETIQSPKADGEGTAASQGAAETGPQPL